MFEERGKRRGEKERRGGGRRGEEENWEGRLRSRREEVRRSEGVRK